MKIMFWVLWVFDALVASVFGFFFVDGISDGSVSSFNIVLWLGILGALAAILGGSLFLRAKALMVWALLLLCLLAGPALLFGLFFLVLIVSNPRWN